MKKMNFDKKLVVSKETVANLNPDKMQNVKGGIITFQLTICRTRCVSDCQTCDLYY